MSWIVGVGTGKNRFFTCSMPKFTNVVTKLQRQSMRFRWDWKKPESHTQHAAVHDMNCQRCVSELEIMLASLLVQEERQDEARDVLNEAVRVRAAHLETEHIQVVLAQLRLGEFLIAQSDFTAAEEPLLQAYEKLVRHSDVVDPLRWRAATKLVELYQKTGQLKEAAKWQVQLGSLDPPNEVDEEG